MPPSLNAFRDLAISASPRNSAPAPLAVEAKALGSVSVRSYEAAEVPPSEELDVEAPGGPTPSPAMENKLRVLGGSSQMLSQPGPFEVDLWPEVHDAITMCNKNAKEWLRWAEPEPSRAAWESLRDEIYRRCYLEYEEKMALKKAFALYLDPCVQARELAKWEGKEDIDAELFWSARDAEMLETARTERDSALRQFHRRVGFPTDLSDPSLPGRTWLLSWPEMRPIDGATGIRTFALLVVAAPGQILHEGDQHLICKADDMKKVDVDRHYLEMTIKAQPMRLSNEQRMAWGRGMHWKGLVACIVVPPEAEKATKKPRKGKETGDQVVTESVTTRDPFAMGVATREK